MTTSSLGRPRRKAPGDKGYRGVQINLNNTDDAEEFYAFRDSLEQQFPDLNISNTGIVRWLVHNFQEGNFKWRGPKATHDDPIPKEVL